MKMEMRTVKNCVCSNPNCRKFGMCFANKPFAEAALIAPLPMYGSTEGRSGEGARAGNGEMPSRLTPDGLIELRAECPFRSCCEVAAANHCTHQGTQHQVPFSCAIARAFDLTAAKQADAP